MAYTQTDFSSIERPKWAEEGEVVFRYGKHNFYRL
jgi:hypothetical protein